MKRVPPTIVRRLALAPLIAALDAAVVVLSPLLLLVAAVLSPVFGGWRPLRLTLIVVAFAARHLEALLALLRLWMRAGAGRRLNSEANAGRPLRRHAPLRRGRQPDDHPPGAR
ncbi:MAG: hypothetical protein M3P50_12600 [Actinomycetota bacterium]|nr:hypothetical protein [Actinomycetota bacterium]